MSGQQHDRQQQQQQWAGQPPAQQPSQPTQPRFQYYGGAQQPQPGPPPFQLRPPFQPGGAAPARPQAPAQQQYPQSPVHQAQPHAFPQQPAYGQQPGYAAPQAGYGPQPGYAPQPGGPAPQQGFFLDGQNALMANLAGNMLQQQGSSYIQKGQAFMQSKMGFLSSSLLQYYFNVGSSYVPNKLLMLLTPFLKRWTYVRELEQISGGNKYLPPRQDVNAPDLYIPLCALMTYVVLAGMVATANRRFSPSSLYSLASSAWGAWLLHTVLLKALLYMLGLAAAVPFLELACYAGYPFVAVCLSMTAGVLPLSLGLWLYRAAWAYASLCMAVFMVRTMKRVIFYEARQYSIESKSHNYLLLGLGAFQFVFIAWLAVLK